jgi:hypothetical protein
MNISLDQPVIDLALDYMKRVLARGKALATTLLRASPLTGKSFIVLSPIALDTAQLAQFDFGHGSSPLNALEKVTVGLQPYLASPIVGATGELAEFIGDLLNTEGSMCILENSLAESGDAWLRRSSSRIITHGKDVFHLLLSGDSKEQIEQAIRQSHSIPTSIGAVGKLALESREKVLSTHTITTEQLAEFSESTFCVFVGGYDGEGYIVWANSIGK